MRFYVCIFCSKNIYDFSNWKWEWRFYIRRTWQGGRSAYWWWPGRSLHSYVLFLKAHLCDSATLAYGSCSCCYYCLVISHSFATPWTVAHQAPLSMGFSKQELLEWVFMPFSRGSSQLRDQTRISCISRRVLGHWASRVLQDHAQVPALLGGCSPSTSSGCWFDEHFLTIYNQPPLGPGDA